MGGLGTSAEANSGVSLVNRLVTSSWIELIEGMECLDIGSGMGQQYFVSILCKFAFSFNLYYYYLSNSDSLSYRNLERDPFTLNEPIFVYPSILFTLLVYLHFESLEFKNRYKLYAAVTKILFQIPIENPNPYCANLLMLLFFFFPRCVSFIHASKSTPRPHRE